MTLLDVSIVNVALPAVQRGLGPSSAELSWAVSGYVLIFGLVLVAAGRLGDDRGRRRMFLVSLALFTLTVPRRAWPRNPHLAGGDPTAAGRRRGHAHPAGHRLHPTAVHRP